jgi:hypothetical protein
MLCAGLLLGLAAAQIAQAQNLLYNGSFEVRLAGGAPTGWTLSGPGSLGTTTAFNPPDGSYIGYVWGSGGTSNPSRMYQQTNATPGATYSLTFYSGTHDPSVQPTIALRFYNSSSVEVGTPAVHIITTDLGACNCVGGPYTLTATAPTGAAYVRVVLTDPSTSQAAAKADAMSLTVSSSTTDLGDLPDAGAGASAIVVDATSSRKAQGTNTVAFTHTTGAGSNRLLLVGVSKEDDLGSATFTVTGITYAGQSLTRLVQNTSSEAEGEIWSLVNPPSGAGLLTVSLTGAEAIDSVVVGATTFTGVDQTNPLSATNSATGTASPATLTLASATGKVVFGTLALDDARTATVGAGQTELWSDFTETASSDGIRGAGSVEPGAASTTMFWTIAADNWVLCAVSINAATVPGTGPGNYQTLLADNGPRHTIVSGAPRLGTNEDAEADGQPNAAATGDDLAGSPDDEDGVTIPTLVLGQTASLTVSVTGAAGKLDAWIDWNANGSFDTGEQIATNRAVSLGANSLNVAVPAGASNSVSLGARFRISSAGSLPPTGAASNGEVEDYMVTVSQCNVVASATKTDVTCNGAANGTITASATGGTAPYQYKLDSGSFQSSGAFTGVAAGAHTVTVKDANNCTATASVTITQPAALVAAAVKTDITCNGATNGTITASATGGTSPYQYKLDSGSFQSSGAFTGVAAGAHTVTVKDANNCTATASVTITQPAALVAAAVKTDITCNGATNGTITASATGGTSPYQYKLDSGSFQSSGAFTGVAAGAHTVTVKDANNCTATANVTITQPAALVAAAVKTDITCNGATNGTITASATGGTSPYQYKLDSGSFQSSGAFTGVAAGAHTVTVKDANNCTATKSVTITQPAALVAAAVKTDITCNGATNGTITASATGGTSPYQYKLDSGSFQSSGAFTGVAAGAHTVTVKDANNCTATASVTITQPAALVAAAVKTDITCNGATNGTITASATGGTSPYQYKLDSGSFQSSGAFTGVAAGAHTVTVKDANNCTATASVTITQPTLSLGNRVFLDSGVGGGIANNGLQDGSEPGIPSVVVKLFAADGSGNPTGSVLGTQTTDANGWYRFDGLNSGTYVVVVDVAGSGSALSSLSSSAGFSTDNALTGDLRDHGKDTPLASGSVLPGGIASSPVSLICGQIPTGEATGTGAGANGPSGDANDNLVVDFGFTSPDGPCAPGSFTFSGNDSTSGTAGNVKSYTVGGVSVKATAWGRSKTADDWAPAYLGAYSGGLGVTDTFSDGDGSNNQHAVDNSGANNYLLFEFSQPVAIDKAYLGWVSGDSDLQIWLGTFPDPYNNHLTLSDAVLASFSYSETNAGGSTARWAQFNQSSNFVNTLLVAARVTQANDYFKFESLDICAPTTTFSLGNRVFADNGTGGGTANDGIQNGTEPGIAGVIVKLFGADGSGNPTGSALGTQTTDASGWYRFDGLAAGSYVPVVDVTSSGGTLSGLVSSTGNSTVTTLAGDLRDHGKDAPLGLGSVLPNGIASVAVTLGTGLQPIGEATGTGQGANGPAGDASDNLTLDFGFVASSAPCLPGTLTFTGSDPLDGTDGNFKTNSVNGVFVRASAWGRSRTTGAWAPAYLGAYSGGLGVTDTFSDGTGGNNQHMVDNYGSDNFVLFEFSQPVIVDRAYLGYVVTDSDLQAWVGTFPNPYANHLTLSDSVVMSFGYTETNLASSAATRWAELNPGQVVGNAFLVAAWPGAPTFDDYFKVEKLDICVPSNTLTILCANDKTVQCGNSWTFDLPTASSTCGNPAVTITVLSTVTNASGSCGNTFVATRTWEATDACGGRAQCSQTVVVVDTTKPVLPVLPPGGYLGCNPTPPSCVTTLKATDNCDGLIAVLCAPGPITGDGCAKQQLFTYSATDACGNTASGTVTYTWKVDTTKPVLPTLPVGGDLGCNPATLPECVTTLTATDNCDGQLPVSCVAGAITGDGCNKTQLFTYSATDACGNTASGTVTYRWKVDTTKPVLPTLPVGGDLGCNPATLPACVTTLVATDNCDGQIPVLCVAGAITGDDCNKTQIFTYSATDACGNTASGTVTYRWKVDTTKPVLPTLPTGGDLGCNPATLPVCVTTLTATDNCDGQLPVSCVPGAITGDDCNKVQVFTYSATDACGNTASGTVTYRWKVDTTKPVLPTLPTGGDLGCNPATLPACVTTLTATDNCDGQLPVACVAGAITGDDCAKQQLFTYSATDACGNTASGTVTYRWKVDTTKPVLPTLPTGGDLGCNPATLPECVTTLKATDNCDGQLPVSCVAGAITGDDCAKQQLFTYSATDACGNTASGTVTYTWKVDTTKPVLPTLPVGGDLGCNPATLPECVTTLKATDNCDGQLPVSCVAGAITGDDCAKQQIFTYSATDACGNTASGTVTYRWKVDTTKPVLPTLPTGGDLGCNPATLPACVTTLTATDNCDGQLPVACVAGAITGDDCAKQQIFTYSATDACGNTASGTVTYRWKVDTTKPVLPTLPTGGDLGCNPATLPVCVTTLTATDNCDGQLPVSCVPGAITGDDCAKQQIFTYSATDACGNTASGTVTYRWKVDTTKPVLPTLPTGGDLGCNPATLPACVTTLTATDNCDGQLPVACVPGAITGDDCAKQQIFTYSATDACGNTASGTVTYRWKVDTTKPVLPTLPVGGDLGCNPATLPACVTTLTATDNCDGQLPVSCVAGAITGDDCAKQQIFTYSATDACGNTASGTVTYRWKVDTTKPVLPTLPVGGDLGCNPATLPVCVTTLTATDNCDGQLPVACVAGAITGDGCNKTQVFTYSATDACGNTASGTVTYRWKVDTTKPVLPTLPVGGDLGCNPATLPACVTTLTATDNCDGQLPVACVAGAITGDACNKVQVFTYSATDACGNTASGTVTYTWKVDTTKPVLPTLPTGGDLGCNPATLPVCVTTLTATDNCDGQIPVLCVAGDITGGACNKTQVFTYSATDACGNTASGTVTYTWKVDTTKPVLPTLPVGGDLGCNPATLPVCVTTLTATDNCDGQLPVACVAGAITGDDCNKTQVFTYSATDACGNTASGTVTYTWKVDTTKPVLPTLPVGGDLGCNPATLPACVTTLTATDNCDGQLPVACVAGAITGDGCNKTQLFTYSATDACGNTASGTVTYRWKVDTTKPVLPTLPTGGDLGCNPATLPVCVTTLTATDNCDGQLPVACVAGAITGDGCNKTQVFTYSATDACGNTASGTVTYTWKVDTTKPVLPTLPVGGDLGCNPATLPECVTTLKATDNCDGQLPVSCVAGAITGDDCAKQQVFTYSATDACGNTASGTVTYTWKVDTTKPVLPTLPVGGDLGCNPATLPECVTTLKATDNCDGQLPVSCVAGAITGDDCAKQQVFTYSATDACGNTASGTVTYTWKVDTTKPVLPTLPTGGDLGCNPATLPVCVTTLTATDNCDGQIPVSCVAGAITGDACNKVQVFTYSATDACGNTASGTVTYTWKVDTTKPVLPTLPTGGDLGCNPATLPECVTTLKATDNCDGQLPVSCVAGAITGDDCAKQQIFTYSATDACGNTASGTVTYRWKVDTTKPVLPTLPTGGDLGCNPATLPECVTTLKATDNCDGQLPVSCVAGAITGDDCAKQQIFTYSATDACGNTASGTVTYRWKVDTTKPVLPTLPTGGDLGCNPATLPECVTTLKATDNCDGQLPVSCVAGAITGDDCAKQQIFTYSATDACGNTASGTVTYRWKVDTTKPVLPTLPTGGDLGCNPATLPECVTTLTATDNCDGQLPVACVAGAITGDDCAKQQIFTYSATDACGNTASGTVTYRWKVDTTKPVLPTLPVGGDLGCNPATLPACVTTLVATDNCDGQIPVSCVPGAITGDDCAKQQIFTYSATDACGNTASGTVTYRWKVDTTKPVLPTLPVGGDLGCNPATLPACVTTLTATDNCDGQLPVSCVAGAITGDDCAKQQIFTYSATDACGNTASGTVTYRWKVDTTKPVLPTLPVGGDLGCNPATLPACVTTLTATDNCDGQLPVSCVAGAITGDDCAKQQIFTYSATDACGNTASGTVTYRWKVDTTKPVLPTLPVGGDLGCNPATLPVCVTTLTATDNCDGQLPVACVAGAITGDDCAKQQVFTYSATDACGNTASGTVTYRWKVDTTKPVLPTLPVGGDLGCNPATLPACVTTLTATDNCDGQLPVACVAGAITGDACNKVQVFTYSATDACGNTASGTVTYTWKVDTTKPVLPTLPTGGDLGCNPATLPVCVTTLTATDNCDGQIPVLCVAGDITGGACNKTQVFTYSATDACGNTASGTVTYTWKVDTTKPVLPTLPVGGDLGCNPATLPVCVTTLTATDNCDGQLPVACVAGAITGDDCNKTQVFTYSATDACGNTASGTVTYTWKVDTTKPVLPTLPVGGDLGCNPATLPACVTTLTATDNCDGQLPVACVAGAITGDGCNKTQLFTYSATDACGNTASGTVTYRWKVDTTKPVLPTLPTGGDLGCNPATLPVCVTTLTATDNCDGQLPVACVAGAITGDGCNKTQVFTYSATDACGNTASGTVTYTWKVDTTKPVLPTLPVGGDLGCNPATLPECVTTLKATDNCDGQLPVSCVAGAITGDDCAKQQVFTYSATDACGNTASGTVTYTWKVDTTKPVLPTLPTGGDLGCNPATLPVCVTTLTATDNCDGQIPVSCVAGAITGDACNKVQVFTYSATDACGNTASGTVTYTWKVDTTKPVLPTLPTGGDLGCNPATLPACVTTLTATDNCDGQLPVACVAGAITGDDCNKVQVFTYSATDACGNTASGTVTYTWKVDTTKPVLPTLPTGGDLGCNPATLPACVTTLTATDNCDGQLPVACVAGAITGDDCNKVQVFTYSATDACGNTASGTVTYRWKVDTTKPVLPTLPTGGDLGCNPATLPECVTTLKATDNCDGQLPVSCVAGAITGDDCAKQQIFTYSATDACGNTASGTVTYRWKVDTTKPVLPTLPTGGDLGCNPATLPECVTTLKATDNCDGQLPVSCVAGAITGDDCAKQQIFTYSATDACGNTASGTVTYRWKVDTTKPVLPTLPTGGDLGCNPATLPECVTTLTATDNCDGQLPVACVAGAITGDDCAKQQIFTYSATDACGNTASGTVTYRWKVDTTKPVLPTLPVGGDLGCNPATLPACVTTLVATDNCDGQIPVSCVPGAITGDDCAKQQIFTYSATDACGNTASGTVTYRWKVDTTKPVLPTLPVGGDLGCNPATLPACVTTLTATDNCDGQLPVSCVAGAITGDDCAKQQIFTYSATDACGNTASGTVTYRWKVDTTKPVLPTLPVGGDLGCNPATLPVCVTTLTATDNCDGQLPVACVAGAITGDDCAKQQVFTYSATDACGNTASGTVTYRWKVDTTKPVLPTLPVGGDLGCNPATLPECVTTLKATDNCDGQLPVSCVAGAITGDDCAKQQVFTYSATDACGNTASGTVTYTWKVDTTKPVLPTLPTGGDLGCNPATLPVCVTTLTATDNCDGQIPVSCVAGAITGDACNKVQVFTYSATDACGNTASGTVTYTWKVDTTKPVLPTLPTGGDLGCNPATLPECVTTLKATDNCDGQLPVACVAGAITGDDCAKQQIFTYSATDACGNTASGTVTYRWKVDTTKPVLPTLPTGGDLGCNPATLPACVTTLTATDNCDGQLPVACVAGAITSDGCNKTQIFTYSATDACGNTASGTVTYRWKVDTTPPSLTCAGNKAIACGSTWTFDPPTASDLCGTPVVTVVSTVTNANADGSYTVTRTWIAGDACGNSAQCSQVVTVLPCYSLGNRVFLDNGAGGGVANNALQDGTEPGIGGVVVRLFAADVSGNPVGSPLFSQVTDADGWYRFDGLQAGRYVPVVDRNASPAIISAGLLSSTGFTFDTTITGDKRDHGQDTPLGAVSVLPGGIAGVVATLGLGLQPTGEAVSTGQGAHGPNGDVADNLTLDFGFIPPQFDPNLFSLGNRVWRDINNNGRQDGAEPGIANVWVALFVADGSGAPLFEIDRQLTDPSGYYRFDFLIAGRYVPVVDVVASGSVLDGLASSTGITTGTTTPADQYDHGYDTPLDGVSVLPGGILGVAVTLGPSLQPLNEPDISTGQGAHGPSGDTNDLLVVDFGFAQVFSLGNRVFLDDGSGGGVADNGIQDGTEPGIADVVLKVFAADISGNPTGPSLGMQTTDADGYYRFDGLVAGTYVVVVDTPSSFMVLNGLSSSTGYSTDTTISGDLHDHGRDTLLALGTVLPGGIASGPVTIGPNIQPLGEVVSTGAGAHGPTGDPGDNLVMDFGFHRSSVTLASIASVSAQAHEGVVTVRWVTVSEVSTVAYDLQRQLPDGTWLTVNADPVFAFGALPGALYDVVDAGAQARQTYRYQIVEYLESGDVRMHGPYDVTVGGLPGAPVQITSCQMQAGQLRLTWTGEAGATYLLERSASVGAQADWSEVLLISPSDTSALVPVDGAAGFFRVFRLP